MVHLYSVKSICADYGLNEVDSDTKFKLNLFGARYTNFLCVRQNQYFAVENAQIQPTCVGYSANGLDSCDANEYVCCGTGRALGSYGYPSQHKVCLDLVFAVDSRMHPNCPTDSNNTQIVSTTTSVASSLAPSSFPTSSFSSVFPSTSLPTVLERTSSTPTITPSSTPSSLVTLTLVNINGEQLARPENHNLLLQGLHVDHPEIDRIEILSTEQFVDFSVTILIVTPPATILPESQSKLADFLLHSLPSLSLRQPVEETDSKTSYFQSSMIFGVIFLLLCLVMFYLCRRSTAQKDDPKVIVDVSEYINTNAELHEGSIARAAGISLNEGGGHLSPGKFEGRARWTIEGIVPNLPEEKHNHIPDPVTLFPTTPYDHFPSTPNKEGPGFLSVDVDNRSSGHSFNSVQTDSCELYSTCDSPEGDQSTLKFKI